MGCGVRTDGLTFLPVCMFLRSKQHLRADLISLMDDAKVRKTLPVSLRCVNSKSSSEA